MIPIQLRERAPKQEFQLPGDAITELTTLSRYVRLEEHRNGTVALSANQYVGAFRAAEWRCGSTRRFPSGACCTC